MHETEDIARRRACRPSRPRDDPSRLRARLLERIARLRFATVTEPVRIGSIELPFTRVREPDAVLDRIVEEEDLRERLSGVRRTGDELHLPYWAELWDSSFGLGTFLARQRSPERSPGLQAWDPFPHVLDLGCGMGLTGLVAAALGAHVTLADLEPQALLFARLNTLPYHDQVCVRRLDWRRDRLSRRFDLILGADVLYERAQWDHLEPFWRAHLASDGAVLLGEPGRQTGDAFPEWISSRGWSFERFEQSTPRRRLPIRIFRLRLG
jgi:predicted nicotinamide N-methyase